MIDTARKFSDHRTLVAYQKRIEASLRHQNPPCWFRSGSLPSSVGFHDERQSIRILYCIVCIVEHAIGSRVTDTTVWDQVVTASVGTGLVNLRHEKTAAQDDTDSDSVSESDFHSLIGMPASN